MIAVRAELVNRREGRTASKVRYERWVDGKATTRRYLVYACMRPGSEPKVNGDGGGGGGE
jgi:hypothetical protein